jgi:hypothetical protein
VKTSKVGEPDAGMALEPAAGNEETGVGLALPGNGVSCVAGVVVGPADPALGAPAAVIEGAVAVAGPGAPDRPRA